MTPGRSSSEPSARKRRRGALAQDENPGGRLFLREPGYRVRLGYRDKLIHWSQDARDQASIYREYVKWEAELRDPSALYDLLDRAYAIACTPPFGPVAISVSRDILMSAVAEAAPER